MNNASNYNSAAFLLSAAKLEQLPGDSGHEVAFIGRSNAGKSSAINAITGIKGLARASKTPGRTQLINLFDIGNNNRLVDLPGYGYTKAPVSISQRWLERVNEYLETRKCLSGLVLIMDIRHPLKEQDQRLIDWALKCELPIHILLTKTDKLKRGPATNTLLKIQQTIKPYCNLVSVQLFSSLDQTGLNEVYQKLGEWFAGHRTCHL